MIHLRIPLERVLWAASSNGCCSKYQLPETSQSGCETEVTLQDAELKGASAIIDEVTALRRLEGRLVCGNTFKMSALWAITSCNSKKKSASATMDVVTAVMQMEGT